jgi:hypothetical protein
LDKHLFIHQRKYVLLHVYNVLHGKPLKPKLFVFCYSWHIRKAKAYSKAKFILRTSKGRQVCFRPILNVSCSFRFQRNTKANLLGHYPKLKLSWNAKIEIQSYNRASCCTTQTFNFSSPTRREKNKGLIAG